MREWKYEKSQFAAAPDLCFIFVSSATAIRFLCLRVRVFSARAVSLLIFPSLCARYSSLACMQQQQQQADADDNRSSFPSLFSETAVALAADV